MVGSPESELVCRISRLRLVPCPFRVGFPRTILASLQRDVGHLGVIPWVSLLASTVVVILVVVVGLQTCGYLVRYYPS